MATTHFSGPLVITNLHFNPSFVTVADADQTILPENNGKPHLVSNVSADRTFTLPEAKAGLVVEFIANAVVADGHDWFIITPGGGVGGYGDNNYFTGGVVHLDTDANSAGDEVVPVRPDGNSNSSLHVILPDVGTAIKFVCDGTLWNISGIVVSTAAPEFADQAQE